VLANGVELDAATYLKRLRSGDTVVAHAFSTDIAQAAADDPDLAFVVPPAGGMRWIDSLCIPRQAPRPDLARRFIEFYLEPEVSAANAVAIGADTGNEAAREFLPAELLDSESFEAPAALASVLHFTEPLSDELEDAYASAFDAAKGG